MVTVDDTIMNNYQILLKYFSSARLNDIMQFYSLPTFGSKDERIDRLLKSDQFDPNELPDLLYKTELADICYAFDIKRSGNKMTLWKRISEFVHNVQIGYNNTNNKDTHFLTYQEVLYLNAWTVVHRILDYNSSSSFNTYKRKHPELKETELREVYHYVYDAYQYAKDFLKDQIDQQKDEMIVYDNWMVGKRKRPAELFEFEKEFWDTYPKLSKDLVISMFTQIFFWYYLK